MKYKVYMHMHYRIYSCNSRTFNKHRFIQTEFILLVHYCARISHHWQCCYLCRTGRATARCFAQGRPRCCRACIFDMLVTLKLLATTFVPTLLQTSTVHLWTLSRSLPSAFLNGRSLASMHMRALCFCHELPQVHQFRALPLILRFHRFTFRTHTP